MFVSPGARMRIAAPNPTKALAVSGNHRMQGGFCSGVALAAAGASAPDWKMTMNTKRRERIIDEHQAAAWIEDRMTIAVGDPPPMALVRQIIRRGVRGLSVVGSGFALDLLIAAGCVRKTISYY